MTLLDDMLALLPDNTSGAIGADDLRTIVTDLYNNAQPIDADLTTIAGLTATTDRFLQSKSSAWTTRTPAQVAADIQSSLTLTESQVTNLTTDLAAKQPLDSDLTAIAALTATTDSIIQSKGSAWTARTIAQLLVDLAAPGTTFQPLDGDLTAIAALTATTDNILQAKGSAWSSRTLAQLMVDLAALGTTFQPLDSDLTTISGLTATTDNFLVAVSSAWASRTPAQVKTTLVLNNVDNTADASKPVSTAQAAAVQGVVSYVGTSFGGPNNQNLVASSIYDRHVHQDSSVSSFSGTTTVTLQTTNARAGDTRSLRLDYTGSGTVEIRNATSGGTLLGTLPTTTGIYWVWSEYSGSAWSNALITPETLITQLAAKQPLDSDLTTIAALTATTDSFMQSKGSAWSARTVAQVLTDLAVPGTTFQPLDSDLTTIAGLTATTDSFIQSKSSAWSSRTVAQVRTDLNSAMSYSATKTGTVATVTGVIKLYNDTGRTLTIVAVRATVGTAPTGASLLVDVNKNGTTIFTTQSNRPTIAISGTTDKADAIDVPSWADGDALTIDIDQVGSTIPGSDLIVTIWAV